MRVRNGVFASLMTVAMLVSLLTPLARGFIPEPYELYGVARDQNTVVLTDGSPIRSFVDGVDYSNMTSVFSRPSMNDGYFDIDTYGNYKTNDTPPDPGTPWIKEGADTNESIMYTWGQMDNSTPIGGAPWKTAVVFKETHDWQTGLPPQAGNLNAAPDALQPPLIKIQSLVTYSMIRPFTDYVWLCNPTPAPVDASKFKLVKNEPGILNGRTFSVPSGTIQPYQGYYVDLETVDWFVDTGDAVKLVWTNDPLNPNAPFGGKDIVVDRVEFNRTTAPPVGGPLTNGTLFWEPGNTNIRGTIPNDEWAPWWPSGGTGYGMNRTASCKDTNSASRDFWVFSEIGRPNNPPNAPYPICLQGLCSDAVDSRMYHITLLTNFPVTWVHSDPDLDPQTQADMRINESFDGSGPTIWTRTVSTGPPVTFNGGLIKCKDYRLEVHTRDATQWGKWAFLPFHTNCAPTQLNNRAPGNSANVPQSASQQVWWSNAIDLDPTDSINYTYEVADNLGFVGPIASGTTSNNYSAPFATVCGTVYYWHVNASDGWESIPFTSPWAFTAVCVPAPTVTNVKVDNMLQGNALLAHFTKRTAFDFTWTFTGSVSPPRTQSISNVTVKLNSDDSIVWWHNITNAAQVDPYGGSALVDGTCYYVVVLAADSGTPALWSAWSARVDFCINTPPPVPTQLAPADASQPVEGSRTVYWSAVTDANGDTVTYDYCFGTDSTLATCTTPVTTSNNYSSSFTTVALTTYYWKVRAYDSSEYSAWTGIWSFTPQTSGPPNTPPTIAITAPTTGPRLKQSDTYIIRWTMGDAQDANSLLVVFLNYTYGGTTHTLVRVVGVESYQWTVPAINATGVIIDATVIDTGHLKNYSSSGTFEIYYEPYQPPPPPPPDNLMVYLIIAIVIAVVLGLILFFLMKRKKPKEEEEAGAPAAEEAPPEEVAEEEITEEEAPPPKPAPKVAPPVPAAVKPAAKAPTKTKECASCGTIVSVTDKECFMCGAKL